MKKRQMLQEQLPVSLCLTFLPAFLSTICTFCSCVLCGIIEGHSNKQRRASSISLTRGLRRCWRGSCVCCCMAAAFAASATAKRAAAAFDYNKRTFFLTYLRAIRQSYCNYFTVGISSLHTASISVAQSLTLLAVKKNNLVYANTTAPSRGRGLKTYRQP